MAERSEEIQDIIERMPTQWSAWVALVVTILMSIVVTLGFTISYPDTVDGQVSITAQEAPVRLVANSTGQLHLLAKNRTEISKGDVIGYIDNGMTIGAMKKLDRLSKIKIEPNAILELPTMESLGELASSFEEFVLAYKNYDLLRNSKKYANARKNLSAQIEADKRVADNMKREQQIKEKIENNAYSQLKADSTLLSMNGISKTDFRNQHNNYLSQREANISLESSRLEKLSTISRNHLEVSRMDIEETEALINAYATLVAKRNALMNNFVLWKHKYVIFAPMEGTLEFLGFWRENIFVQSGQELFTIIPQQRNVVGEVTIPSLGAGKVEQGQKVNIKLNDYPYDEFGLIKGQVESISKLSGKSKQNDNVIETYLVTISLPEGLKTNYGKTLALNFETKGTAEIITQPKSLIERLFDNLKSKAEK